MFQRLLTQIRDWLNKMINNKSVSDKLGVDIAISTAMATELEIWSNMYIGEASWLNSEIISLGLASSIAGEIAMSTTIEMEVDVTGSARADYLSDEMDKIVPELRKQVEYANAKGGLVIKVYELNGELFRDYVQADQFYPVDFDGNGNITSAVFSDQRKQGEFWYTRLEYHFWENAQYVILNKAYKSNTQGVLGNEVSLSIVNEWADIDPEVFVSGLSSPLFAYFKYPFANAVDPSSPLGVSCYSRAVEIIEKADRVMSDLYWEFESGKRAIYVDETAFAKGSDDLPKLKDKRLYRSLRGVGPIGDKGKLFDAWTPEFRDAAYARGLNVILKRIEYNCGMSYGIISDPAEVAKTATEIKTSKQRYYATVQDNQKALESALNQLLYVMDVYADLFSLAPSGEYKATYHFDDSIVADHDTQFAQDSISVTQRTMSKQTFIERNYGVTPEEAKKLLKIIDGEKESVGFFGKEDDGDV